MPADRPPRVTTISPDLGRSFSWNSTADLTFCSRSRVCSSKARCSPPASTREPKPLR